MRRLTLLVWLGCIQPAPADDLGRLFTDAEQRSTLTPSRFPKSPAVLDRPRAEAVALSGLVSKQGGSETLWINHRALSKGESGSQVEVLDTNGPHAVVLIPGASQTVSLKPGQVWSEGGRVRDAFEQGLATKRRPPP
jgi:hypothetical protein